MRAREKGHRWTTVEHLLLRLLDVPSIQERLKSCGVDQVELRVDLERLIEDTQRFSSADLEDTEPTLAFQRVIQHAILKVQKAKRLEVTSIDVFESVVADAKRSLKPAVERRIAACKR